MGRTMASTRPTRSPRRFVLACLAGLLVAGCGVVPGVGEDDPGGEPGIGAGFGEPEVVASGLEAPWGLAYLPDGDALVSERDSGRILQVGPGTGPRVVGTVPGVEPGGEGGACDQQIAPARRGECARAAVGVGLIVDR